MNSLPPIVRQLKQSSFSVLQNHFGEFFASCDDLFFELASKSYNNQEQQRYFEAMREIRLQQPLILQRFKDDYERAFLLLTLQSKQPSVEFQDALHSLSLVGKDEAEMEVALISCIDHIQRTAQTDLYELNLRLDSLFPQTTILETNNPLAPRQLCEQFFNATQIAVLDSSIRIILYKHFDRAMSRNLAGLYQFANQFLANAGVLADLKPSVIKSKTATPSRSDQQSNTNQPSAADKLADHLADHILSGHTLTSYGPAVSNPIRFQPATIQYHQLSELLGKLRQQTGLPFTINTTASNAPPLSQPELLQALTRATLNSEAANAPNTVRDAVTEVFAVAARAGQQRSLKPSDEDIINIVAMFFDFVLNDNQLPAPFQALIARLQIPILKVALQDQGLFDNSSHPARLLINQIAEIAMHWQGAEDYQQDPFYKQVVAIVHAAHDERNPSAAFFKQQYKALNDYIDTEGKRIALIEHRTNKAAEGKARMEHANKQLQGILWQRLHDKTLPDFVGLFILNYWYKALNFILLRHGIESTYWLKAIQVVDDLVWALQSPSDEKSRARLARLVPKLIVRLHSGLKLLGEPPAPALEQLRQIKELLVAIKDGNPFAVNRYTFNELIRQEERRTSMQPQKSWRDLTALERQQIKKQAIHHSFLLQASNLEVGTWFIYQDSIRGKSTRCKLTIKLSELDKYLFVNRLGMRVLEIDKKQVASLLEQRHLEVLERSQLFDRALDNIVTGLKQLSA